ncbi:ShlB/FhaC/HecB family hemolysin secretion/activation protein [Novosphingobium fuchskuhlense]|uniref:ShlB/FhaC/HecB family hemolysin secretion/activation protein n=1 Tax=Novosphingobium fuchskuhlense TaxID=1117702 RepID=UPI0009EA2388|nr:ShlB/FhaC/HecB family hemolysin secretion/activation protein [Novosphingobium fuchskuhlense]
MHEGAISGRRRAKSALGRWLSSALVAGLLGIGVVSPTALFAQVSTPTVSGPSRDELGGITRAPAASAPRLTVSGGIERSGCPLADPQFSQIKTTITTITFSGLKGAEASELDAAWKPLAGTPQPIAVLCEIRDAAATILRAKGYLAAVQVPVQRIENGQVRMEVLYARITSIRARGETRGAERKLMSYLGRLTRDDIFDRNRAERYLLLARDLPGYNVQLTLRPAGTAPGDLIGEVTVLRQKFVADVSVQNLSSAATGRWGGQVRTQAFGITGEGDATSISYYVTSDLREQRILQASHEFRPGSDGLLVGASLTYAWTRPDLGQSAGGAVLDAHTLLASLYARYPLRRAQSGDFWLGGGFDLLNQTSTLIVPLSDDRLRVLWARLDFDRVDLTRAEPAWRFGGSLELRQGLAGLGASPSCLGAACNGRVPTSRFDAAPSATVVRGDVEYERAVGRFSLSVHPRGQYAFRKVLGFEAFAPGNYTVGRGYDPGMITGDSGLGVASELRGPHLPIGRGNGPVVQPFAFFDAAWAWDRDAGKPQRLSSVGGGLRADLGSRFRLDAKVAVPLVRAGFANRKPAPRVLVSLTTRLLPWGSR